MVWWREKKRSISNDDLQSEAEFKWVLKALSGAAQWRAMWESQWNDECLDFQLQRINEAHTHGAVGFFFRTTA